MKLLPPFAPRIDTDLEGITGIEGGVVELSNAWVKGADFTGTTRLSIDTARIEGTLTGLLLDKLEMTDVECVKLEAAVLQAYKANWLRVLSTDCRLTGAEFAEGYFEDCLFRNVKLDEVGFRFARFKRVRFENCVLCRADFSNAKLTQVTFTGCSLESTNFVSAVCTGVDVTTEDLTGIRGVLGLKGATISGEQLVQLAPLFASELGFHVEDKL